MIRVLVLIAITGFLAGVVALAGAAALGGPELAARHGDWVVDWDDPKDRMERHGDWRPAASVAAESGEVTREIVWDGSSQAIFEIPASIEYTQAAGPGAVRIIGPKDVVERVRLNAGQLSLEGDSTDVARLRVVMTAPAVTRFEVGGDDRLEIRNYKQDKLAIAASGAAEVEADGQAGAVDLELSGSSEADLSDLGSDQATADVSGSAHAVLAPRESASLEVSGSGEVKLTSRPAHLSTDISGAGAVTFEDGSRASDTDAPHKPAAQGARETD